MKKGTSNSIRELAYYSSLGLSVALAIFIGLFLGVWLDTKFDTSPVLTLIFLGFGITAGFMNLVKAAKRSRKL
ncbi:MAG: AtpZ/AtpI family protein [Thermodesulfobacteriota bacterium]|nr:AtpZ/AtpI family protein [Thermodesulfobacteriota bacterium]